MSDIATQQSVSKFDDSQGSPAPLTVSDVPSPLVDHTRYKIVGRLGEGGMGVVYKAEHRVMGRTVALKVLNAGTMSANPSAVDRFRREVRLASRLSHPNIVTAFDADEAGGLHFLVMEYVDGSSLDRIVRDRGKLPVPLACELIRQAAIGLQHAHEKGMVHRDIKPHNLMLTRTGQVKILDFGLARVAAGEGVDPASLTAMAITKPQTLMGTPDFLSPEQARNAVGLDIRSDLYSLGCTLYYLLAGKPPFGGVGAYAKMIAHFKEPAPILSASRHDIPHELEKLFQKLMAKSPDDRFQTPDEVAAALLPFTTECVDLPRLAVDSDLEAGESIFLNAKPTGGEETQPSYVSEVTNTSLPMASEIEASRADLLPLSQSQEASSELSPPNVRRRGRIVILAGLVFLGLGLGGLAKWLTTKQEEVPRIETIANQKPASNEPHIETPAVPDVQASASTSIPTLESKQSGKSVVKSPTPATPVLILANPPVPMFRKKQVLLIVPPEYASNELSVVTDSFRARDVFVMTASAERKLLDGYRFVKIDRTLSGHFLPEYTLKDVSSVFLDSVDAVIFLPGDVRNFALRAGHEVKRIVDKAVQKKKIIGAIGGGIIVLGSQGLLEHSEVSNVPNRSQIAAQLTVKTWRDDPKVVVDLPFITAGEFSHGKALVDEVYKAMPERRR